MSSVLNIDKFGNFGVNNLKIELLFISNG
ncbi:hypothetical protein VAS14_15264 [Photobacterium angustum S14]|uniref:Uncharacterized protein n=1 Tax=Photobacterium angustum (strain S14 / CCUG 15956) TaxID=314292 RepID=Q1ZTS2_PHOAS|nr:hypothetical protein VAS14_15264 [Photobacterium angustum S14]